MSDKDYSYKNGEGNVTLGNVKQLVYNTDLPWYYEGTEPKLFDQLTGKNLNEPLRRLLENDNYLKDAIETGTKFPDASLTEKGLVQLSSEINSDSETLAATPKAVKTLYDLIQVSTGNIENLDRVLSTVNEHQEMMALLDYTQEVNQEDMVPYIYYKVPFNKDNQYLIIDKSTGEPSVVQYDGVEDKVIHHYYIMYKSTSDSGSQVRNVGIEYVQTGIPGYALLDEINRFSAKNYFEISPDVPDVDSLDRSNKAVNTNTLHVVADTLDNRVSLVIEEVMKNSDSISNYDGRFTDLTNRVTELERKIDENPEINVPNATYDTKGILRLANIQEIIAGTSTDSAVTPNSLKFITNSINAEITTNRDRIEELERKIGSGGSGGSNPDLEDKVSSLENTISQLQSTVLRLEQMISDRDEIINDLQNKLSKGRVEFYTSDVPESIESNVLYVTEKDNIWNN